jgi:phosphatidylserine decarboxylase
MYIFFIVVLVAAVATLILVRQSSVPNATRAKLSAAVLLFTAAAIGALFFFYRYPVVRKIEETDPYAVYSPAYGKVMNITKRPDNTTYVAIFLSPLDVHYQFFPVSGRVKEVLYDATGKFELAYELNKSNGNEKCIHVIENEYGDFTVYQIAGFLVRRISPYDKVGQHAVSGECMGLIHFGSRVDIIIPQSDRFDLSVKEGDKVNGLDTVLGRFRT